MLNITFMYKKKGGEKWATKRWITNDIGYPDTLKKMYPRNQYDFKIVSTKTC